MIVFISLELVRMDKTYMTHLRQQFRVDILMIHIFTWMYMFDYYTRYPAKERLSVLGKLDDGPARYFPNRDNQPVLLTLRIATLNAL